ncbi:SDR family oxidoreductase [soil metagenome]
MSAPRVLVTGATGKTGSAVAGELLAHGVTVRALVRTEDARSRRLAEAGAEVVVADMFDHQQVAAAMRDVQRLYYVPPWHPHMLHSAVTFATAARDEGVEAVVGLSQWLAQPDHPSLATRQNWLTDRLFDLVPDAAHVVVNPGFFADNYLQGLIGLSAQLGILPIPSGQGRNAPPSNEDIARVVTAALLDPATHDGATYRPTGPELIDARDMAGTLTDVLGRRVRHLDLPVWAFMRALKVMGPRFGIDRFQMTGARWYYQEQKAGTWEVGAPTTHVRDLTGREPEDFTTIAQRYSRRSDTRRTPRNLARALWDMTLIGLVPPPRLDRLVRLQQHPEPAMPSLSITSPHWQGSHAPGAGAAVVAAPEARRARIHTVGGS